VLLDGLEGVKVDTGPLVLVFGLLGLAFEVARLELVDIEVDCGDFVSDLLPETGEGLRVDFGDVRLKQLESFL
jgi:hypothetical protein